MDYMASGAGTIMTDDDYETLDEIGYQKQKLEVTQFSSSAQTALMGFIMTSHLIVYLFLGVTNNLVVRTNCHETI